MASAGFLALNRALYGAVRPLLFRASAQRAHERTIDLLRRLDGHEGALNLLRRMHRLAFDPQPTGVGGVDLPYPLMLAAGFVKGEGFPDEDSALKALEQGANLIPGWRSMPALVGPVEFGSFTRWPRLGNAVPVVWRHVPSRSTQNRVGLRNPGAQAAAAFLARNRLFLPETYGLNIAVSPGVDDPDQQQREVVEAVGFFIEQGISPAWVTLNLSCPNTEDDPNGRQTEALTRALCSALIERMREATSVGATHVSPLHEIMPERRSIPLWVKISPELADEQYTILMRVFAEVGVSAVIATNTLARPAPDLPGVAAGVGGGLLHDCAVAATIRLSQEKVRHQYPVDVVACGGIMDATSYRDFTQAGAQAAQYWSALVYRGPLAAALILNEENYA